MLKEYYRIGVCSQIAFDEELKQATARGVWEAMSKGGDLPAGMETSPNPAVVAKPLCPHIFRYCCIANICLAPSSAGDVHRPVAAPTEKP